MTRNYSMHETAKNGGRDDCAVGLIRPVDPEYYRALHLALDSAYTSADSPAREVASLVTRAGRGEVSLDLLFACFGKGELLSAAMAVESPGAAALVSFPSRVSNALTEQATVAVLDALCEAAWATPLVLLEALVPDEANAAKRVLQQVGFRRLTRLVYLTRPVRSSRVQNRTPVGFGWVAYSEVTKPLFCTAMDQTYLQSLDCPELTGMRSNEEVLAGHQATGTFDPTGWWVATVKDQPVGILCLNRLTDQPATEIVYVGVGSAFRRQGIGNALLAKALTESYRMGAKLVTLAVDERNTPALELYDRWGFKAVLSRDAWIATRDNPAP